METTRVSEAIDQLHNLGAKLKTASGPELGELLRRIVSRVDVFWEPVARGRKTWYLFSRGVVKLRPVVELGGTEGSGYRPTG
jgi:hypothetical protein